MTLDEPSSSPTAGVPATPARPIIPDYELLKFVDRGSYGDVWLARSVTGLYRAIKIVWRARFPDPQPYEREFKGLKEFAAISLLEARQLALLHVGRTDEFFYYVMELADDAESGREIDPKRYRPNTLKEMRERRGRIPATDVVALGVELARGLATLHAHGLVHRDIKPSNVILVSGVPKLADIGLVATASAALTFVGTEGYVPPEGPGAPAADVFSLGKVLYELATGLDRRDYPSLPPALGEFPDRKELLELNAVFVRACEPDARNRFPDAGALRDELLLLQAGKSVRRLRATERHLSRALRVAAVLAVAATLGGAGAWIEHKRAARAEAERDDLARRAIYSAALTQAQHALEQAEYGRARQFLESVVPASGSPDIRGFEWHAFWAEAQGDPAIVLRKSGSSGQRVRYSPSARIIAAHTSDREAILWSDETKLELGRIKGISTLAGFSEDGSWVYGVSQGKLRRWRTRDGTADEQNGFAASWPLGSTGDNRWITLNLPASGGRLSLHCYDFAAGKETWNREVPTASAQGVGSYYSAAITPNGQRCALALNYRHGSTVSWRIVVFSLPDMNVIWQEENITHRPSLLAFGPRPDTLVCVWDDTGEINLLDLRGQQWRWHTQMPMNRLAALAHDGSHSLVVGGRSGTLLFIDADSGRIVGARHGQETDVQDAVFLANPSRLVSTGGGGDVRVWNLNDNSAQRELTGFWAPAGGGRQVCVSAKGEWIAATGYLAIGQGTSPDNPYTRVLHVGVTPSEIGISDAIAPISFDESDQNLWVLTKARKLEARSTTDPAHVNQSIPLPFQPRFAAASSDCRQIACFDEKDLLMFVETDTQRVSAPIQTGHDYAYWAALSGDGRFAASSGRDLTVRLWDVGTGRPILTWNVSGQVVNGAFSPDGHKLAMLYGNGRLEMRDLAGKAPPRTLITSSGILQAIAFDRLEPRLFLGGREGIIHVIDTDRWQEIAQLRAAGVSEKLGTMARAAITADGSLLAGYTETGTIRLWRRNRPP